MPAKDLVRATAFENGEKRYFTGVPCKNGHLVERYSFDGICVECSRLKKDRWFKAKLLADPGWNARQKAKDRARHPEKYKARMAKFVSSRTEEYWLTTRAKRYGLSLASFLAMYEAQGGKCWICSKPCDLRGKAHICIDHCHKTKRVRGLLCQTCNKSIGQFKDDPALLRRAAEYLEFPPLVATSPATLAPL